MKKSTKWIIGAAVAAFVVILVGSQFITRINEGHVGVVYSPSGGVKDEVLSPGWHPIGFFEKVTEYPTRLQTVEYKQVQSATQDGKNITIENVSFNYQVEADKVITAFKTFGPLSISEIENNYLRTRLADAARKGISKYTVIDIYGEKSSDAAVDIQAKFAENIKALGFVVSDLTLGVPTPDPKTQEAIDARVQASQELERKNTELEIAKKEAERLLTEAQGVANAEIEKARGVSEANKQLEKSITPELIEYEKAKKWDGKVPVVDASGDSKSGLIFDVSSVTQGATK